MVLLFDQKPKVNSSAMQPVLTGSCWCGMTPPLIHDSSADGTEEIQRKTYINVLELLAIVETVWTVGKEFLQNREVVFFCDNTSVMSLAAPVHSYARSPDLATLSNTLHLALVALKCTPFFEWVPSLDIPS